MQLSDPRNRHGARVHLPDPWNTPGTILDPRSAWVDSTNPFAGDYPDHFVFLVVLRDDAPRCEEWLDQIDRARAVGVYVQLPAFLRGSNHLVIVAGDHDLDQTTFIDTPLARHPRTRRGRHHRNRVPR